MWFFTRRRIHESLSLAAVLSAAISLHALWIVNLLIGRYPDLTVYFDLASGLGIICGLYLFGLVVFFFSLGTIAVFYKDKDCSHHRLNVFLFLLVSLIIYVIMTVPVVYELLV
ncbi:MAG: hypothetical protein UX09_C0060G0009 [Candidatus Uhrbacteria bacterium GW2011_GWE2_45_35]|uniref:Uncharacterized protein n=2 Tax=Candidatus Uhriibacteriota TaxID=1752732 RepID=A0A0G1M988_9BACT|nr:MAG: hypothetical protein UW63_C0076G0009 [Candidatus Uhrbacteria bacterium GW2011_GWF2_44_350]KKU06074.1 MAG: hypothetical protein UX09_C0060G0009 [Candidatus Uhrbacteria bacterium GW2011_GWE2_45_35]HBR81106.1 hypothetical protein [Candidatus Uhrbacteria bacterium]HCU32134.1 hypothetical protein [Candidatus Uhrbacteria bacterium]